MPKVSVVINCHNGEKYLKETIESVNGQSYKDYEVIFWDNASDDKTAFIVKKYARNLQYFYSDELIPLGHARNKALGQCSGEYIAFLDSDDLWDTEKMARQVEVMEQNQDVGLVMTNFRTFNMFSNVVSDKSNEPDRIYDFEQFITNYAYCLSTFMIRKVCMEGMPLWFDQRFEYAEEYDFFSRLVYRWKAYYVGEPLAIRRMHGEMNTIRLAAKIPIEHQMTLDNLRKYIPKLDEEHPRVVRKIEYVRDYMEAKYRFMTSDNKQIRELVKPYVFMEKRAFAYYLIALLPKKLSDRIYRRIYNNRI